MVETRFSGELARMVSENATSSEEREGKVIQSSCFLFFVVIREIGAPGVVKWLSRDSVVCTCLRVRAVPSRDQN